jgi:hypothetical protein
MDEKNKSKEQSKETTSASCGKQVWVKPQVAFVQPQLTKQGALAKLTGQGFFGAFSPGADD